MRTLSLLSGAAVSVAVLTACDSEVTEPPFLPETSPTPSEEATFPPEPTPTTTLADLESFRAFAPQVEAAVEERDVDFFMDVAVVSTAVCEEGGYLPSLLCEELAAGTTIEGVWLGRWRSEPSLLMVDEFRESLEDYLVSLADPMLYAIAARDRYVGGTSGGRAVFAVVSSSENPPGFARVFEFARIDEQWRMQQMISIPRTGSGGTDYAEEWLSGDCSDCYDYWERWEGTP